MQLLVKKYVKTESLDKNDFEITTHQVVLVGSVEDVIMQFTVKSTELSQLKEMVPIERGMAVELNLE